MSEPLKISVDQYLRMIKEGVFEVLGDTRIELIHGELLEIPVPTPLHAESSTRLIEWSRPDFPDHQPLAVRLKSPITIVPLKSCPEPDLIWIEKGNYWDRFPDSSEVKLLVEIADKNPAYDCDLKADLYAAAGIRDYWVVDLPNRLIHVFREPKDGVYSQHRTAAMGDEICPLANPQYPLIVSRLLGP